MMILKLLKTSNYGTMMMRIETVMMMMMKMMIWNNGDGLKVKGWGWCSGKFHHNCGFQSAQMTPWKYHHCSPPDLRHIDDDVQVLSYSWWKYIMLSRRNGNMMVMGFVHLRAPINSNDAIKMAPSVMIMMIRMMTMIVTMMVPPIIWDDAMKIPGLGQREGVRRLPEVRR